MKKLISLGVVVGLGICAGKVINKMMDKKIDEIEEKELEELKDIQDEMEIEERIDRLERKEIHRRLRQLKNEAILVGFGVAVIYEIVWVYKYSHDCSLSTLCSIVALANDVKENPDFVDDFTKIAKAIYDVDLRNKMLSHMKEV